MKLRAIKGHFGKYIDLNTGSIIDGEHSLCELRFFKEGEFYIMNLILNSKEKKVIVSIKLITENISSLLDNNFTLLNNVDFVIEEKEGSNATT